MIKDKIKPLKEITDDTGMHEGKESTLKQCPKCYQLFDKEHKCGDMWHVCTICRISLEKGGKEKKVRWGNNLYTSLGRSKKHYRLINSFVCYQCACNIAKLLKEDNK